MSKKIITLLLALALVVTAFAGCTIKVNPSDPTDAPDDKIGGQVILGSTTELSGDFRWPGFGGSSAGAADQDISRLTAGLSTMESTQGGSYSWSTTVVKSHEEKENEDGTYTVTIEINEGLVFSDGTPVKAVNYLADVLSFSTPVSVAAGHTGMGGQAFVGFTSFNLYCGSDVTIEGATKEFSGVRLLGDYKFSLTISSEFYPYYFAYTYSAVSPDPLGLALGDGVEIKDDGNGCYLSDNYYEKAADSKADALTYKTATTIMENRYDVTKYPYSGPYTIKSWDAEKKECTLELNPLYAGNFEGQKPHVQTLVYVKIISETQLDQLKTGAIDVISGITGGDDTKAALAIVDGTKFTETHYQRAGYGKIEFECDFGPTSYTEVRQAVAYLLDRTAFCQAFTGGYGVTVDGPYSPDFTMWKAVKDDINVNAYEYSLANAKKTLADAGWVYNSKGEAFVEGQTGVDTVRYKKLEGAYLTDVNKNFKSVENTDGITYQTVEVNGEYYIPLVINWFGTVPNSVTDLISTMLANSSDVTAAGMVIRATTGDFTKLLGEIYRQPSYGYNGTPTYGMLNLATSWSNAIYDYAYNWSTDMTYFQYSSNKLFDEYDYAFPYETHKGLTYAQAMEQSGGKLGMDYLSMAMVYSATTEAEYNEWWKAYIERWNYLMPDIPLYSNYYYDVYNSKIQNFQTSPFFGPARAILYAWVK